MKKKLVAMVCALALAMAMPALAWATNSPQKVTSNTCTASQGATLTVTGKADDSTSKIVVEATSDQASNVSLSATQKIVGTFKVYDVPAGSTYGPYTLTFNVGSEYNGATATVFIEHQGRDANLGTETKTATVSNGNVTISTAEGLFYFAKKVNAGNNFAGKTVTLQPHDVLIIASGELHSIRAPKTGERYIMNYSVSYFHQIQDMAELFNTFYPFRLVTRQEDPELADQLFAVLAQIEGEYFSTNVYRESEIMALMLHFFSIFGRYEHRQNSEQVLDYPKQQDHMRRFAELCAYINNHCTERLSVEDLASRAGFSVYHFSRLFKENTGMTCHNYLVARRIIYAKTLLVDDTIPITEIAMRSGFNSIATFNRLFKAQIGYTPTEYRQMASHG